MSTSGSASGATGAPPDNHIIDFIKRIIQIETSYDKFVVLATFGFIVLTNDNYKNFYNTKAPGLLTSTIRQVDQLTEKEWGLNLNNIFKFVSDQLLKIDDTAYASTDPYPNKIKTDLKINFGNSFEINFNSNFDTDLNTTKTNFEKNFVNLAQVFYETEFCVSVSKITNNDGGADLSTELITNINNFIKDCNVFIDGRTQPQKSLKVLYYFPFTQTLSQKINKDDFSKFVEFETVNKLSSLKSLSGALNSKSNIKHQIIVLDGESVKIEDLKKLFTKRAYYTTIIVVNDSINFAEYLPPAVAAPATTAPAVAAAQAEVPKNIRLVHIKTTNNIITANNAVNTLTYQCNKIISHDFPANIIKDQGINKNIITIEYNSNPETAVEVLKYAVLSNVVVYIESSEN